MSQTDKWYVPQEWSLPFGRHKGQTLDLVPTDYLAWAIAHGIIRSPELRQAIWAEFGRRKATQIMMRVAEDLLSGEPYRSRT